MSRLAGISLLESACSSAELAARQQRVVAVDLGEQALLCGYRVHLRRGDREHLRGTSHLAVDFLLDLAMCPQVIPQPVDLVQDHEATRPRGRIVTGHVLVPHFEIGLRDARVGRQDEQDRVRVGQVRQRQLGLGADRVEAGGVEDHQALLQQRVGKLMIACRQQGMSTVPSSSRSSEAIRSSPSSNRPYLRARPAGTCLTCDTRASTSPMLAADARSSGSVTHSSG